MAEERQPSAIKEGDQAPEAVPAAAEDRKAAAALDSLDARGQDDGSTKTKADSDALDNAMQKLDVGAKKTEAAEKSKVVKVELADVNLLVRWRTVQVFTIL